MNDQYKELRKVADKLFYRFNDWTDDKAALSGIASHVREVVEDFEKSKNPRSVEDRVKRVISDLEDLKRGDGSSMDFHHVDELINQYEDLRQDIRKLSNY